MRAPGAIVGAVVGTLVLIVAVGGGVVYANKRATAARLRKLKASAEALRSGPSAYMSAWAIAAQDAKDAPQPTVIYQVNVGGLTSGRGGRGSSGVAGLAAYGVPRGTGGARG